MKKLISVFLTLCMVLSMLVLPTFATEYKNLDGITALPAYAEGVELTEGAYTVSDLSVLDAWVEAGITLSDKTIYLAQDVTYTDVIGVAGSVSLPFSGIFDGNGNSITLTQSSGVGLFAYTNGATIQNLTIAQGSSVTATAIRVGALVGRTTDTTIKNVTNNATVSGGDTAGGLVGHVHSGTLTVENCVNNGAVTATSQFAGGIYGDSATSTTIIVKNTVNNGAISAPNKRWVGGIGARAMGTIQISDCVNHGEITGLQEVGGILGHLNSGVGDATTNWVKNCVNTGTITFTTTTKNVGQMGAGIVARTQDGIKISNCTNFGHVYSTSGQGVGGTILGSSQNNGTTDTGLLTTLENCTNYGQRTAVNRDTNSGFDADLVGGWNGNCMPAVNNCADKQSYTTHLIGYQMTEIYNNGEEDVQDIRFVATIDSLNYSEVGFNIVVKNSNGETLASFSDASDYVYTKLLAVESEGDILRDNYRKGGYLFALSITGVTAGNYIFEVETYAKDMDGNAVSTSCDVKTTSAITFGDMGN